jgi:hypothetical protein
MLPSLAIVCWEEEKDRGREEDGKKGDESPWKNTSGSHGNPI